MHFEPLVRLLAKVSSPGTLRGWGQGRKRGQGQGQEQGQGQGQGQGHGRPCPLAPRSLRCPLGLYPRALRGVLSFPTNTVLLSPASRSLSGPWLSAFPSRRPRSIPTKFSHRPFRHRPAPAPAPCRMFPSWALGAPRAPRGPWPHPAHAADPGPAPCRGAGPVPAAPLPGSFIKIAPSQARPRAGSRIQMFSRCSPGPTPVARGQNVPGGWETVRGQQMEEEEEEALPQPRGASQHSTQAGDEAGGLQGAAGGCGELRGAEPTPVWPLVLAQPSP